MIYLDTSVALAHLFAEDRRPPAWLWEETLVASRLLEYELWTRVHARKLTRTHGDAVHGLVGRLALLELSPTVLARALESFPAPIRTLDALHLATALVFQETLGAVVLLSFDERIRLNATGLGLPVAPEFTG